MNKKPDIKPVYHLHIPRTAGTNILYEVQRAARIAAEERVNDVNTEYWENYEHLRIYTPHIFEFMYDCAKTSTYNYISGHFAVNPVLELKDPVVFTFVREPVSQFISSAAYRCMTAREEFTSAGLDAYIDGHYDNYGVFQGFSGCDNPQSKFLAAKLVEFELDGIEGASGITFVSIPETLDDVKSYIDSMIIGTVDNRHLVLDRVNEVMRAQFGVEIGNNENHVNSSISLDFTVSNSQIKRIKKKLELDEEIYQYVKNLKTEKNTYV